MKHLLLFLLLVSLCSVHCLNKSEEDSTAPPAPSGKSFFLFGAIFRKFRQRWAGHHDPGGPSGPFFAGPVYPLYGYQNCPAYGCNPALTYRPAPYEPLSSIYYHQQLAPYPPNTVHAPPLPQPAQQVPQQQQQQQQMHQQSNVVIYHQSPNPYGYYAQHIPQPYAPVNPWPPYGANTGPNVGVGGVSPYLPPYPIGNYVPIAPAPSPSYPASSGPLPPAQPGPAYGPPVGTAVGVAVDGPASAPCNAQMYPCSVGK